MRRPLPRGRVISASIQLGHMSIRILTKHRLNSLGEWHKGWQEKCQLPASNAAQDLATNRLRRRSSNAINHNIAPPKYLSDLLPNIWSCSIERIGSPELPHILEVLSSSCRHHRQTGRHCQLNGTTTARRAAAPDEDLCVDRLWPRRRQWEPQLMEQSVGGRGDGDWQHCGVCQGKTVGNCGHQNGFARHVALKAGILGLDELVVSCHPPLEDRIPSASEAGDSY